MPSLLEIQHRVRNAVVADDMAGALLPLISGGRDPEARLAIHRHHYRASLARALMEKFPAVSWLTGEHFASESAEAFVRQHPPVAPCIAEYGADYPAFLASRAGTERLPYLRAFAELEWQIGQVSIAVDCPPVPIERLTSIEASALADHRLAVQPGLRYRAATWPVDELIELSMRDVAPERFAFAPESVRLEIRGARGEFNIERLDAAEFQFRSAIASGQTIGIAAERMLDADPTFDAGQALLRLLSAGLVIAIDKPEMRG